MNQEKILDISWAAIAKISIAVLALYLLFLIKDILIWFLFALIISVLFNPTINFLHKRRVPRVLAASFVYVLVFGGLGLFLYSTALIFIDEIKAFSDAFPKYFEQLSPALTGVGVRAFANTEAFLQATSNTVQQMGANIFNALFIVFGGIFSTLFVVSVAFFISLEGGAVERGLALLFPKRHESMVFSMWGRAQKRVSNWFLTRVLASVFVGLASYISFFLFAINYPISLAMLAGVLNFIPIVGPILTGFLIFVVVVLDSPVMALVVVAAFTLIQQIESNILTPWLSKKFVGVSPVLVLLALAIGGKLWGVLGAFLAVPLFGIIAEFGKEYLERRREE